MQAKLKAILFERHISQKSLANEVGMTERGMTDKIRGKTDFTYTEVYDICHVLNIANPLDIFEPKKKSEMR